MPLEFLMPAKEVLGRYLLDLGGLYALLALIPLILVYLIRPKPKKQTVPALMFLMKERSKWDKSSFLRRIFKDPLLILQILLLLLFAITVSKPFITVSQELFVEKTAIVIDASASMQTRTDGSTRFEEAITIAKKNLGSKNAIITISTIPELVVNDASREKAESILDDLEPKDTSTDIFDTILFAGNYVKAKDRIIIISDFIETTSHKDFNAAKNILKSKGIHVDFIPIIRPDIPSKNIGIIDLDVNEDRTSVQIKNFNDQTEPMDLTMEGANLSAKSIEIEAGAVEVINFPTPGMLSKFEIKPMDNRDDFKLDNEIFISAPSKETIPLLLISNQISKYLETALEVIPNVKVTRGTPPKVPDIAHNIIMLNNIKTDLLLPGIIKKIKKKVENGAALIIIGQESLLQVDFEGMLPVERRSDSSPVIVSDDRYVYTNQINTLTEDINFGKVSKFLDVKPKTDTIVLASVGENTTIVGIKNLGKGMVVYVGLMDDYSDFKTDVFYPVFWKRLFDMALKKQEVSDLNYKTGQVAHLLERQSVNTPNGKVNEEKLILDYQGIYRSDERNFVANLLNERESNINGEKDEMKGVFDTSIMTEKEAPLELARQFLIAVIVFVLLELLWIKFRGDI